MPSVFSALSESLSPRSSKAGVSRPVSQQPLPFQTGSVQGRAFESTPLPSEWIRSGDPVARSMPLAKAADGRLSTGLWECQAGSFTFIFPCDEIVHILEGEVVVEAEGERRHLQAGDVAFFPQGLVSQWTVRRYVKKLAVFRWTPRPWPLRLARRVLAACGLVR